MARHPNDMTVWPVIACRQGHDTHDALEVGVRLGGATPYRDLAPIPRRLAREFAMMVYDWPRYPDSGYCPGHDAVSETIDTLGVWEPTEATLVLSALSASADRLVLDLGAHIGWFTLLALSCGQRVVAVDADSENLRLLSASLALNGWTGRAALHHARIGHDPLDLLPGDSRASLVKMDLEGAEPDACDLLFPALAEQRVDHLLIEVSPVFHGGYPDLVLGLIDLGYVAYALPPKRTPPWPLDTLPADLTRLADEAAVRACVASVPQQDLWFSLPDAPWA